MLRNFDEFPDNEMIVITTTNGKFVGKIQRQDIDFLGSKIRSVTLGRVYHNGEVSDSERLLLDDSIKWNYFSEESKSFQTTVNDAFEKYFENEIKELEEILRDPKLRRNGQMLLRYMPRHANVLKTRASLNTVSKLTNALPKELIDKLTLGGTRKKKKRKSKGYSRRYR